MRTVCSAHVLVDADVKWMCEEGSAQDGALLLQSSTPYDCTVDAHTHGIDYCTHSDLVARLFAAQAGTKRALEELQELCVYAGMQKNARGVEYFPTSDDTPAARAEPAAATPPTLEPTVYTSPSGVAFTRESLRYVEPALLASMGATWRHLLKHNTADALLHFTARDWMALGASAKDVPLIAARLAPYRATA